MSNLISCFLLSLFMYLFQFNVILHVELCIELQAIGFSIGNLLVLLCSLCVEIGIVKMHVDYGLWQFNLLFAVQ